MALEKFTLGTLAEMDNGRIKTAFEQALDRCRFDCEDRPSVEGARKIVLTVTMEPIPTDAGELDTVDVSFDLQERLPKRGSKTYNMQAVAGGLLFNELSPDEVRQKTLDMQPAPKPKQPESAPAKGKEVKTNAG